MVELAREDTLDELFGSYRVLDLADEKGVYCGKQFADLGADVIKVESSCGDSMRFKGPFFQDDPHPEKSLDWLHFNVNKRSVTLNLETEDGKAVFKKLVKTTDALIETYPQGYLKSLGLDYSVLKEINPSLVMCSITPFGQSGPRRGWKSSDMVAMATSGLMYVSGNPDDPPLNVPMEAYHAASEYATAGIVFALYNRGITGQGQYIDISLQECLIAWCGETDNAQNWIVTKQNPIRFGYKGPLAGGPWGGFKCKDGWVIINCIEAHQWDGLSKWIAKVTGDDEVLDDMYKGRAWSRMFYKDIIYHFVSKFVEKLTMNELVKEGQARGVPILPVNTAEEVFNCPQLNERNFFVEADHPVVGRLKYPSPPWRFGSDGSIPHRIRRTAPLLGQHNEEVYCNDLGYSKEQLVMLKSCGAI